VTDFHYACYLSDLAVSYDHQHQGIGKQLQIITQQQLGPHCKLVLISAPAANNYYEKVDISGMNVVGFLYLTVILPKQLCEQKK